MLDTYKSDSPAVAMRQVEVSNYAVLAEVTFLGWDIELASSQHRPLILFRPTSWDGKQPRLGVTAADAEFSTVLQDLAKLPVKKRDQMLTLVYEEPVFVKGGLVPISKHDPESLKIWTTLTGAETSGASQP